MPCVSEECTERKLYIHVICDKYIIDEEYTIWLKLETCDWFTKLWFVGGDVKALDLRTSTHFTLESRTGSAWTSVS